MQPGQTKYAFKRAYSEAPKSPCEALVCENWQRCAEEKLACLLFARYSSGGMMWRKKPANDRRIPDSEWVRLKEKWRCNPTRGIYNRIFRRTDPPASKKPPKAPREEEWIEELMLRWR